MKRAWVILHFYCFQTSPCVFIQSCVAFSDKLQRQQWWGNRKEIHSLGCVQTFDCFCIFQTIFWSGFFLAISGHMYTFSLTAVTQILQRATLHNNLWHTSCNVFLCLRLKANIKVQGSCLNVLLSGICHLVLSWQKPLDHWCALSLQPQSCMAALFVCLVVG